MEYIWAQPEDLDPEDFYFYKSDPNLYRIHDYKECLRNLIADTEEVPASFTEWIDRYFNPLLYIHDSENSLIFGRTFQLNLYTDDFLKELFANILETPATEKVMVVCTFFDKDGNRNHVTYTLSAFRNNIGSFMQTGRLSLDDPNFVDESNVLNNVSDGAENYFPPIHLIDTITFKRPIEYRREFESKQKVNKVNEGGLFPYYIADPSKLSKDTL